MKTFITDEVMTTKLISIPAKMPLREAHELMQERRIRQTPVINERNKIIGVLEDKNLENLEVIEAFYAEDFATPPTTIDAETPLRSVILHMLEKKITWILVTTKNKEVVGIITTDDLLWYLAHLLHENSERKHFLNMDQIQTIGEVSRELAEMGI